MEWYENLWNKTKDGALEVFSNIGSDFIQEQMGSGGFIKIGNPPQGNQTAQEKNAGATASYNTTVGNSQNAGSNVATNANGLGLGFMNDKNSIFYILGGALLIGLLIRGR